MYMYECMYVYISVLYMYVCICILYVYRKHQTHTHTGKLRQLNLVLTDHHMRSSAGLTLAVDKDGQLCISSPSVQLIISLEIAWQKLELSYLF